VRKLAYNDIGVKPNKKDKRWRGQFRFWLDGYKENERELGEFLLKLKQQRNFAKFMRDAVRLLKDLREGNTAVLLEMFPHIQDALPAHVQIAPTTTSSAVKAQLDRLERLMLAQGNEPINEVEITVVDAPSNQRASANEIAQNMAMDMGNLFGDD
jgi:hypothetical protein